VSGGIVAPLSIGYLGCIHCYLSSSYGIALLHGGLPLHEQLLTTDEILMAFP
jgi:hypothetical protein